MKFVEFFAQVLAVMIVVSVSYFIYKLAVCLD